MYLDKSRSAASYSHTLVSMTINEHLSVFYFEIYTVYAAVILTLDHTRTRTRTDTHAHTHTLLQGSEGRVVNVISLWQHWSERKPLPNPNSTPPTPVKEKRNTEESGNKDKYHNTPLQ